MTHGFQRVAAAVPTLRVGDCAFNAEQIIELMTRAEREQVTVLVFPELALTGYTCADLFQHGTLQKGALAALARVLREGSADFSGLAVIGLPLVVDDQVFNCAAVAHRGQVLGIVPKSYIPNYKEFYEARWFSPAASAYSRELSLPGQTAPFGTDLLFAASDCPGLIVGVEVCEDLWVPTPPSSFQALQGATVLLNLSASNEVIGKTAYRRLLVQSQSGRCLAAYVYASNGVWESTTDVVFGGHCLIAENGALLAESPRFDRDNGLLVADIDLDRLRAERFRTNSFAAGLRGAAAWSPDHAPAPPCRRLPFTLGPRASGPGPKARLARPIEAHPFVPSGQEQLRERCEEIFHTQVAGLAKRLEHIGKPPVTIGISGGLDSTLSLLVACKTFDTLQSARDRIHAFTLPGFGTSARTRGNAQALMRQLCVSATEIDICALCLEEMRALGHRPFGIDLTGLSAADFTTRLSQLASRAGQPAALLEDLVFENVQARMRTSLLMNAGFLIGTSDLSELALGWTTYNGDHMSMYNPNVSIPKTLVKFLVRWAAENEFEGEARRILLDIVATEITPELLPVAGDRASQATEQVIGPYELHDFFLFHLLRYGAPPEKILYLAGQARFDREYGHDELRRWLQVFIRRFFTNQFKRSCLPDGPKVGTISLSPRGDWRMPSDAEATLWLEWTSKEETGAGGDGESNADS